MRKSGIIAVLVIAGLFFGASYFITDTFVEELIEDQASAVNGARVDIDNLNFDLFALDMSWDRIQVTNPRSTLTNTFETGRADFDINIWPLILGNNVIVENMQLNGFQLDTPRETDGRIELPEGTASAEDAEPGYVATVANDISKEVKANAQAKFDGVKGQLNADSLVASIDLKSVKKMDSLKTQLSTSYDTWNDKLATVNLRADAESLKKQAEAIEIKDVKDLKKIQSSIKAIGTMRSKADSLRKSLTTLKSDFEKEFKETTSAIGQVDNWIRDDYEYASNLAKLPKIDAQNIGQTLFGEELLGDMDTYLSYAATAREYANRLKGEEEEKIERYEGKDYHFSDKYDYPGFWIKNVHISGVTNNSIELSGKATNITNDQGKTGSPIMINLNGVDENGTGILVKGELNYLEELPRESFEASYQDFSLRNNRLSPSELIPYNVQEGRGSIAGKLDIVDKKIRSEIFYVANNLSFDLSSGGAGESRLDQLIKSAISSTDEINAQAIVDGTAGKLNIKIRSNLDDLFLNALRSTISKEVEQARARIRSEVDKQVNSKKAEVEQLIASNEEKLRQEYVKYEKQIKDQLKIVDEKKEELDKKKKELEDALKKKGKDVLKKIGFGE